MRKLILHIGPGKCGSTTIQDFFKTHTNPCNENLRFLFLDPKEIVKIGAVNPSKNSISYFVKLINDSIKVNPILILSHEFLFDKPNAIKNICSISRNIVDEILIIGYSRKQSGLIYSSYSQWLFRSADRINEINDTLLEIGIDPLHFTGIEKHFIASISNDFYSARQLSNNSILDWNKSYGEIEHFSHSNSAILRCGVLPNKYSGNNLIEDFCDKSGLTISNDYKQFTNSHKNLKFNRDIVEAIYIATELNLDAPTPHSNNDFLYTVSKIISSANSFEDDFISTLKQYVDAYYLDSNMEFCKRYNLDEIHFRAPKRFSKIEILEIIKNEQFKRIETNYMVKKNKDLVGIISDVFFKYYKIQKPPIKNKNSKLRLLWNSIANIFTFK